ncbi:dynein axonemal assembly factor 11-like [Littorina saxatilis]|uniref:U2A'/phosphoprotein 32 family A C-terminal domain-containing protein n=1 Tax=Littorina saxatilis TaxID=31220 RepID=A0AAN9BAP1_9CAEN
MVRITEDLVRKRAEHNELEISTLEEISLHQQDIERIEHLDRWCRELKILYLQSNLIPRIENVSRLKKLEYLNLALNNVERVENLEGCESLKKLDLTVNFVGELTSIESLRGNYHLEEIFLTGNPCTEYEEYREFVIATLPKLKTLDGVDIEKSERIQAVQNLGINRPRIIQQQEEYKKKRAKQKAEAEKKEREEAEKNAQEEEKENQEKQGPDGRWYTDINESDKQKAKEKEHQKKVDEFWQEKTSFTPESRMEVHKKLKEMKEKDEKKDDKEEKKERAMFAPDGRPFNINEDKLDFTLLDDENNNIVLDLAVFRHMDTSLMDCDVQPTYVRVVLKGKLFQLCLPEEINADKASAKRSQTTGHLVVTMPKVKQVLRPKQPEPETKTKKETKKVEEANKENSRSRQVLEVDSNARSGVDIGSIVSDQSKSVVKPLGASRRGTKTERPNSEHFVDNPDVPPLE